MGGGHDLLFDFILLQFFKPSPCLFNATHALHYSCPYSYVFLSWPKFLAWNNVVFLVHNHIINLANQSQQVNISLVNKSQLLQLFFNYILLLINYPSKSFPKFMKFWPNLDQPIPNNFPVGHFSKITLFQHAISRARSGRQNRSVSIKLFPQVIPLTQ